MIASPANGTHTVSKNGPSLPTRSSNSLFHPLYNIYGDFQRAIAVIKGTSTGTARTMTSKDWGSFNNLYPQNGSTMHFFFITACCEYFTRRTYWVQLAFKKARQSKCYVAQPYYLINLLKKTIRIPRLIRKLTSVFYRLSVKCFVWSTILVM